MKIVLGDICLRKSEPTATLFLFAGLRRLKGVGGRVKKRVKNALETFRTQPETGTRIFFTPIGSNPLKSPDFEKINASKLESFY